MACRKPEKEDLGYSSCALLTCRGAACFFLAPRLAILLHKTLTPCVQSSARFVNNTVGSRVDVESSGNDGDGADGGDSWLQAGFRI